MSYLVLARKWRPGTFDEVVGQEHVTRTLKNAILQDRVAHALLFTGSRGVGKTSCARILAKALNCANGPTVDPCGKCPACVEITTGASVDVFEIDGASNNSVDQIREIRESVKFLPTRGKRKMYIIDEVHMLTTSAFNALLKTLEEPPAHVLFVFATTEPHKIPETILSRCQRFDFKRIPELRIVEAIGKIAAAEGVQVEPSALHHIAREAQGGMRDSLSLLDQVIAFCGTNITERQVREVLGIADRRILHDLTRAVLAGDGPGALGLVDDLFRFGLDLQKFAAEFVQHLRDLMVVKVCADPGRLVDLPDGEVEAMAELVRDVHPARIHRLFNALLQGADEISRSPYPKLVLEMSLLRLCHQGATLPLAEVLEGLARLEAKFEDGGGGSPSAPTGAGPTVTPRAASPEGAAAPPTPSGGDRSSATEPAPRLAPAPPEAPSPITAPTPPTFAAPTPPAPPPVPATAPVVASAAVALVEHRPATAAPPVIDFSAASTGFDVPPPPLPPGQAAIARALGLIGADDTVVEAAAPPRPAPAPPVTPVAAPSTPAVEVVLVEPPAPPAEASGDVGAFERLLARVREGDRFYAALVEHAARLVHLGDDALVVAVPEREVAQVRAEAHQIEATAVAVLGRPVSFRVEPCADGDPRLAVETLAERRERLRRELEAARREAARQDPVVQEIVSALGAEIVGVSVGAPAR